MRCVIHDQELQRVIGSEERTTYICFACEDEAMQARLDLEARAILVGAEEIISPMFCNVNRIHIRTIL